MNDEEIDHIGECLPRSIKEGLKDLKQATERKAVKIASPHLRVSFSTDENRYLSEVARIPEDEIRKMAKVGNIYEAVDCSGTEKIIVLDFGGVPILAFSEEVAELSPLERLAMEGEA